MAVEQITGVSAGEMHAKRDFHSLVLGMASTKAMLDAADDAFRNGHLDECERWLDEARYELKSTQEQNAAILRYISDDEHYKAAVQLRYFDQGGWRS